MILDTLAAMADKLDDEKYNFSSTAAQAKTVLDDFRDGNADGVVDTISGSGTLNVENETLTVGSATVTNDKSATLDNWIVGLQNKTPRKVLEDQISPAKFRG